MENKNNFIRENPRQITKEDCNGIEPIKYLYSDKQGHDYWEFVCPQPDCQELFHARRDHVQDGSIKSCGCLKRKRGCNNHKGYPSFFVTLAETVQQNTGGSYTDTPKTDSSYRTLPMLDSAYTLLEADKRLQEERKRLMGESNIDSDYVCTWNNGKLISPNYLTSQFNKIIKNSTLPPIRLHDLRHSTASNLLNRGLSVVQVQEWLGHSSAATTLNFYAHADKTSKQAVADAVQNMIEIPS